MFRKSCKWLLLVAIVFLGIFAGNVQTIGAQEHETEETGVSSAHGNESEEKGSEKLNPGEFIFDHIKDAHEWHIMTIGHTHVSIPLPVIIYSKNKGLNIFMSSKFKHGTATYKGFRLETEGENKNKIFEEDGTKPIDISITKNIVALLVSAFLLLLIFLSIGKRYRKDPLAPPRGIQAWIEPVAIMITDDIIKPSIGPKYERYTPYLLSLFFFIWINNMMGLIPIPPGGANLTGNIAVTGTLAILTLLITTFSGNKNYWKHIFNTPGVPWWLKLPIPIMPLVEFVGLFTKPFALMVRLFANITAGHIMVMAFIMLIYIFAQMSTGLAYGISVVSISFNVFLTFLELLVAFIQAFIFVFLSSIYIGLAVTEHHHEEHQTEHA